MTNTVSRSPLFPCFVAKLLLDLAVTVTIRRIRLVEGPLMAVFRLRAQLDDTVSAGVWRQIESVLVF